MRIAFLGDIHANPQALTVVLADCQGRSINEIYHTGDLVGYNVEFEPVLRMIEEHGIRGVRGNHDMMVLDELPDSHTTRDLRKSLRLSRERLSRQQREILSLLPESIHHQHFVMFHAMPDSPVKALKWPDNALRAAELLDRQYADWNVAIHGHMHIQRVFAVSHHEAAVAFDGPGTFEMNDASRFVVCPGSVGQPRDYSSRTGYMILDTDRGTMEFLRLTYDVRARKRANRRAGVHPQLSRSRLRESLVYLVGTIRRALS